MEKIKIVDVSEIEEAVMKLLLDANINLPEDIIKSFNEARLNESSELAVCILDRLIENAEYAAESKLPICQDTGMVTVFIEIGQNVLLKGGDLSSAVNNGVRRAYKDGYFRCSVVKHPLERVNTNDNTPAVIYTDIVSGSNIEITVMPKGFGSENMSKIKMMKPTANLEQITDFIADTVAESGGNACPPLIVGVGIGGTFDYCARLAKKALAREIGDYNKDSSISELEKLALEKINRTGVGVQGLGGSTTALWLAAEYYPTHIAGLPVAVNISCHATRHKKIKL